MDVLLLAGTGTMGIHLSSILINNGANCWVTSRLNHCNKESLFYLQGNSHDKSFLMEVLSLRKWDSVIDFMYYDTKEFSEICRILLKYTKQYIYISSARVYADSKVRISEDGSRLLDTCKDVDYLGSDEYALAKARQEDILKKSGFSNWTIVRPYITFGESTLQLSPIRKEHWLYRALSGRSIIFSEDLASKRTTFTYGFDVARGIASLVGNNNVLGEAFHITNNESLTWSQILDVYIKVIESFTGKKVRVYMLKQWQPILTGTPEQIKYDRLYSREFDNSKISQYIDTTTFLPTKEGIQKCLETFLSDPKWSECEWAHEAKLDRISGDWVRISDFRKESLRNMLKYYAYRLGLKNKI